MTKILRSFLAAGLLAGSTIPCFAQGGSLFGSNGALSQSSAGGIRTNGSNGTAFGSDNPFGSFGNTGASFGNNQFGSGGGMQAGNNLSGGQTTGNAFRTSGANGQQQSVNGQNRNAQGNANRLGQSGLGRGNNRLGQNGLGRGGRNQNQNINSIGNGQGNNAEPQAQVRIRPQISFNYSTRPTPTVNSAIQTQFTRITRRGSDFSNIDFELGDAGVVVLRGTVPSDQTARLAAALVRLEPGVRTVRNELQTVPSPTPVE